MRGGGVKRGVVRGKGQEGSVVRGGGVKRGVVRGKGSRGGW